MVVWRYVYGEVRGREVRECGMDGMREVRRYGGGGKGERWKRGRWGGVSAERSDEVQRYLSELWVALETGRRNAKIVKQDEK